MRCRNNPFSRCLGELSHAGCCWTSAESQGRAHSWGPAPSLCHQPAPLALLPLKLQPLSGAKVGKRYTGPTPEPVQSALGAAASSAQGFFALHCTCFTGGKKNPRTPFSEGSTAPETAPSDSEITRSLLLASCLELKAQGQTLWVTAPLPNPQHYGNRGHFEPEQAARAEGS